MDQIQDIIDAAAKPHFGRQNPFLELASLVLEARKVGLAYDKLKPTWKKMRDDRRYKRGVFLRFPNDRSISTSHDEALGIAVLSYLFDNGETAREILDEGLIFGLWFTGKNEKGKLLDSEWFTFWRPEQRATMKLAADRKINWLENFALRLSLIKSTSWNMKRVRILFLEGLGYNPKFLERQTIALGDKYRGRYGNNPLYWNIWNL